MRTRSAGNRAWTANALPVRRWQARQWHTEIRTGSPSTVRRSCPQLQAASRVCIARSYEALARREDERRPRLLREVEVADEVPELRRALPHVGARVGAAVRARVEPLTLQEVVLDELHVCVERQRLVVDEAAPRVRADHEAGDAQAVAVLVHPRRDDVVVEAAPVVPGEEDRRALP